MTPRTYTTATMPATFPRRDCFDDWASLPATVCSDATCSSAMAFPPKNEERRQGRPRSPRNGAQQNSTWPTPLCGAGQALLLLNTRALRPRVAVFREARHSFGRLAINILALKLRGA